MIDSLFEIVRLVRKMQFKIFELFFVLQNGTIELSCPKTRIFGIIFILI